MNMYMKWLFTSTMLVAVVGGTNSFVWAKENVSERKTLVSEAKITVAQAITTAEKHANGKASKAELEDENGSLVYSVAVSSNGKSSEVLVDAKNGKVLKVEQDENDEEHEEEENESDED